VNKAELIEALAARLGDKRTATQALDAVLAEIQSAVTKGERVAITGFGAFEKRVRGARTARNPRTGESVKVKKTSVPAFKAGAGFREMVASGKVPKAAPAKKTAGATKSTASKATATKSTAKSTAAKSTSSRSTGTKSTAAKAGGTKSTAKKAPAKAAKTTAATKSTGRTTATAKATKAPAKKSATKKR
jgi:DNA-binding protein HU-beta